MTIKNQIRALQEEIQHLSIGIQSASKEAEAASILNVKAQVAKVAEMQCRSNLLQSKLNQLMVKVLCHE